MNARRRDDDCLPPPLSLPPCSPPPLQHPYFFSDRHAHLAYSGRVVSKYTEWGAWRRCECRQTRYVVKKWRCLPGSTYSVYACKLLCACVCARTYMHPALCLTIGARSSQAKPSQSNLLHTTYIRATTTLPFPPAPRTAQAGM